MIDLKKLREQFEHEGGEVMVDVIDRCEKAEAENAQLKEQLDGMSSYTRVADFEACRAALVTARALAMEEAAQCVAEWVDSINIRHIAIALRSLAPLPSGLVVVPREVVATMRRDLDVYGYGMDDDPAEYDKFVHRQIKKVLSALAALEVIR